MDFFFNSLNEETSNCSLSEQDIWKCPFLRNIERPTKFSFASRNFTGPLKGAPGPIFEDGPNFDLAFKLFHGKDGVVPLSGKSRVCADNLDTEAAPQFNPLAANAASISMSAFGPGGPFSFHSFFGKMQKKTSDSSRKKENPAKDNSKKHEAMGNEWLETGNCPIAKSYRAVSRVLPLVATSLQLSPGMKLKCPPAIVAARAALARTAFVKSLRPQPLPAKMLVIGVLGMAANIPLGIWREHTEKFSPSWFVAVHAAVPFIAMLRKSVIMPKTAMALTVAASIVGQIIGSRAERLRLKTKSEREKLLAQGAPSAVGHLEKREIVWDPLPKKEGVPSAVGQHGKQGIMWDPLPKKSAKTASTPTIVCF
ncbi:uncharacterized protein LOC105172751 isoform X2 [Olea europaea subsp. europaea]|uniref:Uncharacterized protein LOC105172751 isoform X2 n=1 Tax=Olea europaea subsp. europaea TaxID=158383 RepID=A0A8S0PKB8_OLEEU|nr:uncharacterized protein LOC105172751 isoform X2 [Olea europaea subsp. europaea]